MTKLDAKELRASRPTQADLSRIRRREVYIICDNVLDTYNIGSIFRLADAVGAKCVFLCGQSETPPNSRISKASVGTDKWVKWQYASTAVEAIADLKRKFSTVHPSRHSGEPFEVSQDKLRDTRIGKGFRTSQNDKTGIKVVAIEQGKGSIDFRKAKYELPIALVVGNETEGVSKEALKLADTIVEIPMFGVNRSLNVMVSLAIVLYQAIK